MAKKDTRKFSGKLAEPIVIPLPKLLLPGEPCVVEAHGLAETLEKLFLLMAYYGIERKLGEELPWMELAWSLARDFVPGCQLAYDDPIASVFGLPMAGGMKANHKGVAPELWGDRLIGMVKVVQMIPGKQSEKDACCHIAQTFWPELAKRTNQSARDSKAATILKRLQEAKRRSPDFAKTMKNHNKFKANQKAL